MQKGKNVQYAMAGVQMMPSIRMNVRSNVYVPDAEAGQDMQERRSPYYAAQTREQPRIRPTVSYRIAVPFLLALFLVFFGLAADKIVQRMQLTNDINQMEANTLELNIKNKDLEAKVLENRSEIRISYLASDLGLKPALDEDMVPVIAPNTRPAENQNHSLMGSSPLPGGHGNISGSR